MIVVINEEAKPKLSGDLYSVMYIIQLTKTSALAHQFILNGIAYGAIA
jgi:hypothetical protein